MKKTESWLGESLVADCNPMVVVYVTEVEPCLGVRVIDCRPLNVAQQLTVMIPVAAYQES